MELFQELGKVIEARWRATNYDESQLPGIAADALRAAEIPSKISGWDVLKWTIEQGSLPPQKDLHASFGDPPITLYTGSRFFIDVYFWLDGTTAVHQHSFCGAFQVLLGSSLHSWYGFEKREEINAYMEIGDLTLNSCELLNAGDVKEIRSGREYIHSLFHLDQPSATIVVRTDRSPLSLPQFSYHKPSLAIDPFYENEADIKKLQSIGSLYRVNHPEADAIVKRLLEECDVQLSFEVLNTVRRHFKHDPVGAMFNLNGGEARFEEFLEIVRRRHGDSKAELAMAVTEYKETTDEIVRRRAIVTNPEHRFFLALILNVEGKDRILGLVRQRYPDADPLEKILDWVYDLGNTRIAGDQNLNALGIAGFGETDMFILENLLGGRQESEIKTMYEKDYGSERAANANLDEKIAAVKSSSIFKPLLRV